MTKISFQFFGPPCFSLNGTPVRIRRRKAVALAAYLAVTGKPHSRERLAAMFWPESDHKRARASLRKTLSLMTKHLGKYWLVIDRETIGFIPHENLWVDVNRFRKLTSRAFPETGDEEEGSPKLMDDLEAAAQICKRSFLSGFSLKDAPDFEDWQLEQAQWLDCRAATILKRLACWRMDKSAYSKAVSHARHLVALDPLNEEAQRLLIRLFVKTGDLNLALRQYEKCRTLLEKELDTPPEEETRALGEDIRKIRGNGGMDSVPSPPLTNLPAQSTPFIGRKDEIIALARQITAPKVRLLTLTGPGGIGKTRLALEAADTLKDGFPHGVFFVQIADLRSRRDLAAELLKVLGLRSDLKADPERQISNFLRPKKTLLVMDNFEHLPQGGGLVSGLLEQAPSLKILATSRTRLMLKGEHLFRVPDLSRPIYPIGRQGNGICRAEEAWDAVALFLSATRMVRPDYKLDTDNFNGVLRICDLTRGMPLALILAAGWMEVFPADKIADRIQENLDFLSAQIRDAPLRHQSIRAVFDTSWSCMAKGEKELLIKLTVFRHSFTVEAVSRATGIDLATAVRKTAGLARKSLLRADPETGRFEMHPLLRQYAGERLSASGLQDEILDAHKHHYLNLAHNNEQNLIGEAMLACRREMDAEFPNIRQAWLRAVDQKDLKALIHAATGVYAYFDMHTRYHESEALFQPAKTLVMEMAGAETGPDMALILLCWLDMAAQDRITVRQASELWAVARQWLRLAVKRKDLSGKAFSLLLMGAVAQKKKAWEQAVRLFRLSLKGYPGVERAFWVTVRMGLCRQAQGRMDDAIRYFKKGHKAGAGAGDEIKMAWALCNIGICELGKGNLASGETCLQEAADAFDRIKAPIGMVTAYEKLGVISFLKGNLDRAESLMDLALGITEDLGIALPRYRNILALKDLIAFTAGHSDRSEACLARAVKDGQPSWPIC